MHITLLHNPRAGDAAHNRKQLTRLLEEQGFRVSYHETSEDGLERGLAHPADLVAVAGGDGSVVKVAKRLLGRGVPIAVLPLGTANNIARALGLTEPVEQLVAALSGARRRAFDVGIVRGPELEERFLEGVGMGLYTEAMCRIEAGEDTESPDPLVRNDRFLRLLARDFPAGRYTILGDGEDLSGEYVLVEVLNTRTIGPGLALAPGADTSDGTLDLVLVGEGERDTLYRYLDDRIAGKERDPGFPVLRVAEMQIAAGPGGLRVDDEIVRTAGVSAARLFGAGAVSIGVERGAIDFLVPG